MDLGQPRPAAVGCAAALLLGIAGCGGPGRDVSVGARVFDQGCRSCHSLAGDESLRRVGGDLLGYRLDRTQMLELVREMPVRRTLSPSEIAAVSDYVLSLERRAAAARGSP